ncbi:histidine kinase N-terminal 7TM domain-containing protein [Haloarchaeobius sp. DT45]|uniref:histidine kinase N-terminal 7TM domain-containing protein n=1 Tax=Haloarchaeobius sp. DT45 TaxID=3446116 RepID=UPI003F6CBA89
MSGLFTIGGVTYGLYDLVLVLSILASGAAGTLAWKNRQKPIARPLVVMMASSIVWGGGSLVYRYGALSGSYEFALLGSQLVYLGIPVVVAAWFVLALRYAGREDLVDARLLAALAVVPIGVNVLVWTAPMHSLWWSNVGPGTDTVIQYGDGYGIPYYLHFAYGYLLTLAGAVLVFRQVARSKSLYRGQAFSMGIAALMPLVGNVAFFGLTAAGDAVPDLTPLVGFTRVPDFTPVMFAISGVALVAGIFRFGLTEVAPVARATVLDNITDGVFVLDTDDQFVEVNPRAKEILGVEAERVVGRSLADVLGDNEALYQRYVNADEVAEEIRVETDDGPRYFEVEVSALSSERGQRVGRLFIVRDVTDRTHREQELERQNEQLERFTSIVSHDLRRPLARAEETLVRGLRQGDRGELRETRKALSTMDAIVEDMLTLAQQGESIGDDDQEFFPLRDVAREAWNHLDTGGASLTVQDDQYVRADRRRLVRLFENLFENSVEHVGPRAAADGGEDPTTADSVHVRVGTLESTGSVLRPGEQGFYVEDDGPGIAVPDRERVLEAGFSGDDDTGLGLAIVASIADAHGWDVAVTDGTAGGARFEFTGAVVD